jgi:hypothetical protein
MSDEKLPEPIDIDSGDIIGPASSINNTVPRFSSTTGKLLKSSSVVISDTDDLSAASVTLSSLTASTLVAADESKKLTSATVGSGLDLTDGTLSATGGGLAIWTQILDEPGTSLSNWTQVQGSWDIFSSSIRIISAVNTNNRLRLTNLTPQSGLIYEADVLIASTGGYSGDCHAGLVFFSAGIASEGGAFIGLKAPDLNGASGIVYAEEIELAAYETIANYPFSLDTYYKYRVVFASAAADFYINSIYQGSFRPKATNTSKPIYIGLVNYNCIAQFKNLKTYIITPPT